MNRDFSRYTVEIIDNEFTKNGLTYPKTAFIAIETIKKVNKEVEVPVKKEIETNEGTKTVVETTIEIREEPKIEQESLELGFIETEKIYELIDAGADIVLDYCYIKNFSLSRYRESRKLDENMYVKLKKFSASNAFFDTDEMAENLKIDFSFCDFRDTEVNFNKTVFGTGGTTFEAALFGDKYVDFEYTLFYDGNTEFINTKFGKCDISFRNAIFREGKKKFDNAKFNDGEIQFLGTDFGIGDVSFAGITTGLGKINFKVAVFGKGKIDFSHAKFGEGELSFLNTLFGDGNANFKWAEFGKGKKDFTRAKFGKGEVAFTNADFGDGEVVFVDTDFGQGKAIFKSAIFASGKVDFHFSKFGKGDVIFDKAEFGRGLIDFRAVDFNEGKINFYRTDFSDGDIVFEGMKMKKGRLNFKHSYFGTGSINFTAAECDEARAIFDHVNFGQKSATFKNARFSSITFKACHINNYFDVRITKSESIDFSDSIIRDILDLRPHDYDMELKALDLSGIRLLGRIFVDWHDNNVKEFIYQQDTNNRNRAEQFRVLKENYYAIGQYNDEDEAYVEFKRTEAKANLSDATAESKKQLLDRKNELCREFDYRVNRSKIISQLRKAGNTLENSIRKADIIDAFNDEITKEKEQLREDIQTLVFDDLDENDMINVAKYDFVDIILRLPPKTITDQNVLIEEIRNHELADKDQKARLAISKKLLSRLEKSGITMKMRKNNLISILEKIDIKAKCEARYGRRERLKYSMARLLTKPKFLLQSVGAKIKDFFKRLSSHILYWFQWIIFDKVGLYATDPIRVLTSMLFIYLIFVCCYIVFGLTGVADVIYGIGDEHVLSVVAKSFYFSAVTFLTIGYGDFYPVGISRGFAATEGFIGLFLMSYFTVAFVRKILR